MDVDNLDIVNAVADAVASAVKMGPPPPPLPTGWIMKESRSNPGYFYYFHMETGMSSWSPPVQERPQQQLATEQHEQQQHDDEMAEKEQPNPVTPVDEKLGQAVGDQQQSTQSNDEDPETAEDRSSKRRKGDSGSDGNSPKEVRVLHILKKHKDSRRPSSWRQAKITQTVEEAKEELMGMLEILGEEEANPAELRATFEELARTESDCSSAKRGGDLGFFGRRKMQPAFEAASFGLKIGELTKEIVETSSGVHLILRIG